MTVAQILETTRCPRCGAGPGVRCIQGGAYVARIHPARRGLAELHHDWKGAGPMGVDAATRHQWREARSGPRRGSKGR